MASKYLPFVRQRHARLTGKDNEVLILWEKKSKIQFLRSNRLQTWLTGEILFIHKHYPFLINRLGIASSETWNK